MPNIADLLPLPVEVNIGRGNIAVRGLTLEELARVVLIYGKPLAQLLESAQGEGMPDYTGIVAAAPEMVVHLIAMASDTEGQEEMIRKIPGAAQIECLKAIFDLTVPDPKKLYSLLLDVSEKVKSAKPPAGIENVTSAKDSQTSSELSLKEATG